MWSKAICHYTGCHSIIQFHPGDEKVRRTNLYGTTGLVPLPKSHGAYAGGLS
jgi:hypothetical protein